MSVSITGGIHFGSNDGASYFKLSTQIGTLPTVAAAVGPVSSLSISGGFLPAILPPAITVPLAGNILDLLPPPLHGILNFPQGDGPGIFAIIAGTHIELPIHISNPLLLS